MSQATVKEFIASAANIFHSMDHPTGQQIAAKILSLPLNDFQETFPLVKSVSQLPAALEQPGTHPFSQQIMALVEHFPWEVIPPDLVPAGMEGNHAFCQVAGPDGLIIEPSFRMGMYLQVPNVLYPSHSHNAEEFYFILSGSALWQVGDGSFVEREPGSFIRHQPNEPHAIKTQSEVLLTIWAWIGDVSFDSYKTL